MDVQPAVVTASDSASAAIAAAAVAAPPVSAPSDAGGTPGGTTLAAAAPNGAGASPVHDPKLADAVGKLFGSTGEVSVSYKVEKPDEIVTVFTDASGRVLAQFPSEIVIRMAEFFQQLAGGMLDKSV